MRSEQEVREARGVYLNYSRLQAALGNDFEAKVGAGLYAALEWVLNGSEAISQAFIDALADAKVCNARCEDSHA